MEYWERAGVAAVDAGTPAEALNLLQKAQDVAEVLDRYFATHTRSRCMAAMGWGAGITREGTTQCMVHCLRGLALARVALPWEEAYLSQVRWRRRLAMDWRPRSRLLRACLGYSPEPVHVAFERRVAMLDHDSLFLMRPLPLEPAAQEGGPCPGLMTRFLPSADSDPGEGSEGFCSDTFAPCPPKPELCSRDEVLYILEMLCTALLVSKPLDLEGVKYLMWVCRHLKGTQKKRGRCRRLQGILADAKTALSQAEAEERMSLRVAPLLGLSEHLAGAEAGKKA
ncbi:hypothetical protein F751_3468 [Auxenochlorella protothecoides]|uniref:Uncharacterized protein n=1 Tax=Auxenochlorella protothecoides TaxID=3075 RepID=A0A087SC23_AUXPR|nr:hypothetical protein F751_3468 [Auxenochlorella protothecoides]KFM23277.1 hypothetical protein F751_3468 [Auxenochlorella protothecoides]